MNSIQFIFRFLLCLLGILLALPLLVLITMAFQLPITTSGVGYLFGSTLLVSGLLLAPLASRNSLILLIGGAAILAVVISMRFLLAQHDNTQRIKIISLPSG